ncbi:MAG: bifunctional riboflavin kinase/FAD synthetase [Gemmatimonadota bacterium]|nr:bifunctional riboflavin kinase/FAD synthetase [Gemmatimonadota bacterium]
MMGAPGLPRDGRGAVVTVGTFDGLHRGHHEVLREIVGRAERTGRRSVLVTFHPHPLRIIRPEDAPALLTTAGEKKEILAASGLEYAVFLEFTRDLQQYSARRFVTEILLGRLGMEELVIGYDHGFGRDREGGVDMLRQIGQEIGFAVDVVEAVHAQDTPISATRIRRALGAGDVVAAAQGLGRPYSLEGPVVRGAQRGRELGFPTANIAVEESEKLLPREGVYAVRGVVDGERIPGLLHLGPRPTFRGSPPTVELHLLNWAGDLYGKQVRVEFCAWLREILPFASAAALVQQMERDRDEGWELLRGEKGPSACL